MEGPRQAEEPGGPMSPETAARGAPKETLDGSRGWEPPSGGDCFRLREEALRKCPAAAAESCCCLELRGPPKSLDCVWGPSFLGFIGNNKITKNKLRFLLLNSRDPNAPKTDTFSGGPLGDPRLGGRGGPGAPFPGAPLFQLLWMGAEGFFMTCNPNDIKIYLFIYVYHFWIIPPAC